MLLRYLQVRCFVEPDSLPSRCSRRIAFGYEPSWSVVIEDGGQWRIVVSALPRKRWAARVFRRSNNMKSISRPCLSTARNRYFHLPPTLEHDSSYRLGPNWFP